MNLVENYLTENGYDYFGNAAEDMLVFFVRDEDAPSAEPVAQQSNQEVTNVSDETVNGMADSLSVEGAANNSETQAQAYQEGKSNGSGNIAASQENPLGDKESNDTFSSGSASGDDEEGDDSTNLIPNLAPIDDKQTNAEPSRFKN